jgi:hypothetical protein
MIPVRIVCARDAVKTAQTIMRLLAAEEHEVELCYGRASRAQIESARTRREAVLLIWSAGAPSAHYMMQWAKSVDPAKLVEIARGALWPQLDRRASVIDFSSWGGERGGSAWRALEDRLRAVTRATEPPRPPPHRAALVLGLASMAAVTGALVERVYNANHAPMAAPEDVRAEMPAVSYEGQGGPLDAIEPGFTEASVLRVRPAPHVQPLAPVETYVLEETDAAPSMEFEQRNARLLDRLNALTAPLRLGGDNRSNDSGSN